MNNNVRSYSDAVYFQGDLVYYKRVDSSQWKGPASVLGKEGQQVLLKHGGYYIRVHPCRLTHVTPQRKKIESPAQEVAGNESHSKDDVVHDGNKSSVVQESVLKSTMYFDSDDDKIEEPSDLIDFEAELAKEPDPLNSSCSTIASIYDLPLDNEDKTNEEKNVSDPFLLPSKVSSNHLDETNSIQDCPMTKEPSVKKLSFNDIIEIITPDNEVQKVKILSRSGKVGKKGHNRYAQSWNVLTPSGDIQSLDLKNDVSSWQFICKDTIPSSDQELLSNEVYQAEISTEIEEAKSRELNGWKEREVYDEVNDEGQSCIDVRWVVTPKLIDGKLSTKARLVAKGFQEVQDFRTDSPTCARESLRLMTCIVASYKWQIKSIDVKQAFLQGRNLERNVLLRPPPEACTNKLWQLRKCIYGLADAPREFYLRLREELVQLGLTPCPADQGLFMWFPGDDLCGILICHVDDILHGGNDQFYNDIMHSLERTFDIGSKQSSCFTYIGINMKQLPDYSIIIEQKSFTDSIKYLDIDKNRRTSDEVTESERTSLRAAIGQLNWIAGMSRPDLSFDVCQLSSLVKNATVSDMIYANKVFKRAQTEPLSLLVPSLDLSQSRIVTFADASYNNLPEGGSQGGNVIFLSDGKRSTPLQWSSACIKRVVRSTLAAESLSASSACDSSLYLANLVKVVLNNAEDTQVICITDNKSMFDSISTSKPTTEQRLRLDISALREMNEKKEVTFHWVKGQYQLSDCLTKKGASSKSLRDVLSLGTLTH